MYTIYIYIRFPILIVHPLLFVVKITALQLWPTALYTSHEVEVKVLVAEEEVGICFKMEYYPPTNIDQKS